MNVVCGQCGTGYEFDDALVSERGTTVRCMHCGHQFRVHSSRAKAGAPERWIVRKASGEEYIFRSLSELQRAIAQRRVVITDSLSRDGVHFRPMAELSELESFFASVHPGGAQSGRASNASFPSAGSVSARPGEKPARRSSNDAMAITPTAAISVAVPTPRGGFATAATEAVPSPRSGPTAPRQSGLTQPTGLVHPGGASPSSRPTSQPRPVAAPRPAADGESKPKAPSQGAKPEVQARQLLDLKAPPPIYAPTLASEAEVPSGVDASVPAGSLPRRRRGRVGGDDSTLLANGVSDPSSSHVPAPFAVTPEHRSGGPRWILGLVLLGGLALVAGTVGRDYFERFRETRAPAVPADNRVNGFLSEGDELFRAGDLEEARAQYEKASALASEDPAVLQRLLQVETTRADIDWLRLRVLPKASPDVEVVATSLNERTGKLQRRVDELRRVSGATPSTEGALAIVDALRVQGQVAMARTLVQQTAGLNNDARSAYVSAMLDVSDANPNWSSIVSRLKLAVSGERGLGRAQSALVYSLISAGQLEEARQQLEILAGFKRPNALLLDLQKMLSAAVAVPPTETGPAMQEQASEAAGEASVARTERGAAGDDSILSEDPMADAAAARSAGELAKAARLYTYALSKEPGNVAAMTGLGDVARSQGNADIALSHYGAALRTNPNYGPAILSCADLKWSVGDRAGAVVLYRRLGAGAPARVGERVAEFEGSEAPKEAVSAPPSAEVRNSPPMPAAPNPDVGGAPGPAAETQPTSAVGNPEPPQETP